MVYKNVGNVSAEYEHKQREVRPIGLVTEPSLILKLYDMHVRGKPPQDGLIQQSREFLEGEIRKGKVEPYLGLGFAILSEDMFNVARWDTEYPIAVKNQIYGYENGDLRTAKLLDIRDVGAFCIWELGIVSHERNAWKKYLESERREADKKQYLDSVIEGLL